MEVKKSLLAFALLSVIGYGFAGPAKKIFHIPPAMSEKILESTLKCVSKLGIESSVINLLKEGKYTDDDKLIEALLCMNQDVGTGYDNGRVNIDKVMAEMFENKPEIRTVMEECDKDYSKNPGENFKSFLTCFREKAPFKVML